MCGGCELVRDLVGDNIRLSIDANQKWGIDEAIASVARLAHTNLWWVEEPTSPDDVLGHAQIARAIAPIKVAAGEHVANRVMFKQLLASGAIDVCQIDATRVAGVNENVAILLLAAKFGVPVCPHAGGVGLCEVVQHLAMFDFVAVSGSTEIPMDRVRRSPARALRRSRADRPRSLYRSTPTRRQRSDAAGVDRGTSVSRRTCLAKRPRQLVNCSDGQHCLTRAEGWLARRRARLLVGRGGVAVA